MALLAGGCFSTTRPSRHTVTNAEIIRQFAPGAVQIRALTENMKLRSRRSREKANETSDFNPRRPGRCKSTYLAENGLAPFAVTPDDVRLSFGGLAMQKDGRRNHQSGA